MITLNKIYHKINSMTAALIQILSPATKPPKSSCRNVKIPKKCSESIIKTKIQSHGCFGFIVSIQ